MKFLPFASAVAFLSFTSVHASEVVYDGTQDIIAMAPLLDVYRDETGKLDIKDIASPSVIPHFYHSKEQVIFRGWSRSAFWFKALVVNRTSTDQLFYIYFADPWVDEIRLYIADGRGGYSLQRGGDHVGRADAAVPGGRIAFRLSLKSGEAKELYLRTYSPMDAMMLSFMLMTDVKYEAIERQHTYFTIFYLGAVLALLAYNLILFFILFDRGYLYYVLYGVALIFTNLSDKGDAQFWFYPEGSWWSDRSIPEWGILAMLLGTLFTISFLNTREVAPRWHALLKGMAVLLGILWLWGLLTSDLYYHSIFIVLFPGIYVSFIMFVAIVCLKRGYRASRFFIVAFLSAPLGLLAYLAKVMGIIPYSFITYHGLEIGSMLEMVFLSFALGDRIGIMQKEKDRAQAMAQQALSRSKEELEREVKERTAALQLELTERKKLEESLRQAKETAEAATRLKDRFVALVSHDLRSPLGYVASSLMLLADREMPVDEAMRETLQVSALNSVNALLALIEQLLDISKLRSGVIVPAKRFIPVRHQIEKVISHVVPLAEQKGVRIENLVSPDMRMLADPILLGEVVQNLVGNAIKFTKSGDTITIRRHDREPNAITVADTGAGIDPAILPNLFKAEVKTSTVGTSGETGTGLGLPYCQEIIAAHGGTIEVESSPGKGSSFHVILPRFDVIILIADDQPAHRNLMKDAILSELQADFIEAENGVDALEAVQECMPDLVITDINMPEMDGLTLIARVRSLGDGGTVPILATTSGETSHTPVARAKEMALKAGASAFLMKPIIAPEFILLVKQLLVPKSKERPGLLP